MAANKARRTWIVVLIAAVLFGLVLIVKSYGERQEATRAVEIERAGYTTSASLAIALVGASRRVGARGWEERADKTMQDLRERGRKYLTLCRRCASDVACERDVRDIMNGTALSSFNPCD